MTLRGLLTHEEKNYQEWGHERLDTHRPGATRGAVSRCGSAPPGGSRRRSGATSGAAQRGGLAREADPPGASLWAEVAYGLDAPRGLRTPYTGVSLARERGDLARRRALETPGPPSK